MPTVTTGTFFLGRKSVRATTAPDGGFRLAIHAIDRQTRESTESYRLEWDGAPAAAFWAEHAGLLTPGTPVHLALHNPRSFIGALGTPETHASVAQCSLAPLAPSWQKHAAHADQAAQNNNPQPA